MALCNFNITDLKSLLCWPVSLVFAGFLERARGTPNWLFDFALLWLPRLGQVFASQTEAILCDKSGPRNQEKLDWIPCLTQPFGKTNSLAFSSWFKIEDFGGLVMEETFFYFFLEGRCFLAKAITKRELQQYLLRKTFLKLTTAQQKLGLLRVNCSWLFFKSNFNLWYKKWASDYSKWVYLYREASWWIKNNNNKHVGLRIFCEQTLQQKLGKLVWQPHCKSTTKNLSFLTETRVQRRFFLLMFSVQAILFIFFYFARVAKNLEVKRSIRYFLNCQLKFGWNEKISISVTSLLIEESPKFCLAILIW